MEWIADPTAWLGLGTLIVLEIVLGIDNLIFIAILVDRLPPAQRNRVRLLGLSLALLMRVGMLAGISWLQSLTAPLFTVLGNDFSVRDLILIAGGLFLLVKATTELHVRLEGAEAPRPTSGAAPSAFWQAVVQIVILDAVFSIDSVITAVGMVDHFGVMVIAVVIAIAAMILVSGPLTTFVSAHPSVVILCLSFLLTIGFSLFVEGFGLKIPKGYLYAAIAFSVMIEAFNQIASRNRLKRARGANLRSRTAEAVLRLLGGAPAEAPAGDDESSAVAAEVAADVFAPAERTMVASVLSMADRPVRSIMTPSAEVVWLSVNEDADALSRRILQTGFSAYPVCGHKPGHLLGVARAPDLVCDLLEKGRIDPETLDRAPLTFPENESVLHMVEQVRGARVPIAIVNDPSGTIQGIVTPSDLLRALLGGSQQHGKNPAGRVPI
jgi:predicted tellurium resistance membrane protein TerC/CBS domain-containing protein